MCPEREVVFELPVEVEAERLDFVAVFLAGRLVFLVVMLLYTNSDTEEGYSHSGSDIGYNKVCVCANFRVNLAG